MEEISPRVHDPALLRPPLPQIRGQLELNDGRRVIDLRGNGAHDELLVPVEARFAAQLADEALHAVAAVLQAGGLEVGLDGADSACGDDISLQVRTILGTKDGTNSLTNISAKWLGIRTCPFACF